MNRRAVENNSPWTVQALDISPSKTQSWDTNLTWKGQKLKVPEARAGPGIPIRKVINNTKYQEKQNKHIKTQQNQQVSFCKRVNPKTMTGPDGVSLALISEPFRLGKAL